MSVAVLTGAGVSAESGVPTFRGAGGLWRQFRAEDLATADAFRRDPRLVWEWYAWRREVVAACQPNAAHRTIAQMEQAAPDFTLVTQNVDGLHERAGSRHVLRLHGSLWTLRCTREGIRVENHEVPLAALPPRCACGALLRPDVVWFGESLELDTVTAALTAARRADLLLVVGTSALVTPAANLPLVTLEHRGRVVEFNVERTWLSDYVDETILGPAAETLPQWWAEYQSSPQGRG
ncbi:MAG: NAD-dependent deacylase [Anaerolineae bacterium]|nr:NAD-dependent deacylase [Anaerolineae bacterium]